MTSNFAFELAVLSTRGRYADYISKQWDNGSLYTKPVPIILGFRQKCKQSVKYSTHCLEGDYFLCGKLLEETYVILIFMNYEGYKKTVNKWAAPWLMLDSNMNMGISHICLLLSSPMCISSVNCPGNNPNFRGSESIKLVTVHGQCRPGFNWDIRAT